MGFCKRLYYYGDNTPNVVPAKHIDPSLGPGYDYDVCNTEVLLTRMQAQNGRIVLPDGMSYRLLVLPEQRTMPVQVLRKLRLLVAEGATVVGPKPERAPGLRDYPQCDHDVRKLADEIWGDCNGQNVHEHQYGKGRVIWGKRLREILMAEGVPPAFEYKSEHEDTFLDFVHRRVDDGEIYFVCNRKDRQERLDAVFRTGGKQPELWNPVTGEMRPARAFQQVNGRTSLPLTLPPYGSCFVFFRQPISGTAAGSQSVNYPTWRSACELNGSWHVEFDPHWGGPESVSFDRLVSWTDRMEAGIKYYSGKGTYRKNFDLPANLRNSRQRLQLSLGVVKNVAEVRLNGRDLGVLWAKPFSVDITDVVKPVGNQLEIDVINLWWNRLTRDAALPANQRLTRTNRGWDPNAKLLESGLLGPVSLQTVVRDWDE